MVHKATPRGPAKRKTAATDAPIKIEADGRYSVRVKRPIQRGAMKILPRHDRVILRGKVLLEGDNLSKVDVIERLG